VFATGSAVGFVFAWGNVPFAVAGGIGGAFALLQLTGVLGLLAGGDDGHDGDTEHDVDADHDAGGDSDPDHDHDDGGGRSWASSALAPLGFGKIPLSVIWQTFAFIFAVTGFALNLRYLQAGGPPISSLAWTVPSAALTGYAVVAIVAWLLEPVLSSEEHQATRRAALVGQMGVVISSKVDGEFGEVRIRDKTGHDLRVVCKLAKGARSVPTERHSVVVVEYDEARGELFVEPLELEEDSVG
jgi:hypothetical protein